MSEPKEGRTQSNTHNPQTLQQAVALALQGEDSLRGYDIQVDVNGRHVVLQGVVDVLAEKERAAHIAKQVPGVSSLENAITISTDGSITDSDVQFEVAEELNADPRVPLKNIGVEVDGGNARLVGSADAEERAAAEEAAARARGVRKVLNQVKSTDKD